MNRNASSDVGCFNYVSVFFFFFNEIGFAFALIQNPEVF